MLIADGIEAPSTPSPVTPLGARLTRGAGGGGNPQGRSQLLSAIVHSGDSGSSAAPNVGAPASPDSK